MASATVSVTPEKVLQRRPQVNRGGGGTTGKDYFGDYPSNLGGTWRLTGEERNPMKRALIAATAAALFATTLAGGAVAETNDAAPARVEVGDTSETPDVRHILRRCLHLFGERELSESLKERCLELWKRWCQAHPDARYCRRPDVKPHDCRITDRVADRRCVRPHDRPTDRPGDRPIDRPTVRPKDRPNDRPGDRPIDRPTVRPKDRPKDRPTADRVTARVRAVEGKNDVHLRLRPADS